MTSIVIFHTNYYYTLRFLIYVCILNVYIYILGSGTGQDPDVIFRDPDPEFLDHPGFFRDRDFLGFIPKNPSRALLKISGIFRD
jgi:hypothetical protein